MSKNTHPNELPELLLKARSELNLTVRHAARMAGLSAMAISTFERRIGKPRRLTIYRVEELLAKFHYLPKRKQRVT